MMRTLIRLAVAALALVIVSIIAVGFYIDGIARTAIERGSTYALGVESTLDSASIGLFTGSFGLSGFEVANPPGFEDPRFLTLGDAKLDLPMATLREPTVVVSLFAIDGIEVDLDKQQGKANYEVILDNLARFESEDSAPEPTETNAEPGKRFVIQELVIRDLVAHVRIVERGGVPQVDVVVPEIRMKNLGEGKPMTAAEVTNLLVKAVLSSIAEAGSGLPGGVSNALSSGLGRLSSVSVDLPEGGELVDSAAGAVDASKEAAGNALEAGSDATGKALEAGSDATGKALDASRDAADDAGEAVKDLGGKLFGDD